MSFPVTVVFVVLGLALASYAVPVSKTTSAHGAYPTVQTPLGTIQGAVLNTRLVKHIYSFRGIRYAKAPVDELRFQPPVMPDKWEGVYNATNDGPSCPQRRVEPISEDCLFLNVYTTKYPTQKVLENPKRSVLVFFHGGDFTNNSGISAQLGPQYLLDQDIVLVTANYRLGVLGFLNTGDKDATGNFGLKDQVEVLKWVKANIASFGGNPDAVTIAGSGSGGFSVSLHLVSPLSKGLFHKAIIMSGTAFGNVPIANHQKALAKKLAQHLGCPDDTMENIVKCFKSKTALELAAPHCDLKELSKDPYYLWLPTIEQDFSQPRFLTAHPVDLLTKGEIAKVPVLIGATKDEFGFKAFNVAGNETELKLLDNEFDKYAPIAFMYERESENSKLISKGLRSFYFGEAAFDNTLIPKFSELFTDALVGFSVNRAANLLAEKSDQPVFYYVFSFNGKFSNYYLAESNGVSPFGVVHGDDLIYLFHSANFEEFKESDMEMVTVQKMVTLWTNFVKTGQPIPTVIDTLDNVKWEPLTTKSKKYMEIGNKLTMHENLNEKRFAEWEKLFPTAKYSKVHAG